MTDGKFIGRAYVCDDNLIHKLPTFFRHCGEISKLTNIETLKYRKISDMRFISTRVHIKSMNPFSNVSPHNVTRVRTLKTIQLGLNYKFFSQLKSHYRFLVLTHIVRDCFISKLSYIETIFE